MRVYVMCCVFVCAAPCCDVMRCDVCNAYCVCCPGGVNICNVVYVEKEGM